jgi:Chalcone isomerase-like
MRSHPALPQNIVSSGASPFLSRRVFSQGALLLGASAASALIAPSAMAQISAQPQTQPSAQPSTQPASKSATRIAPVELNAFPMPTPWALMGSGALRFFGFKAYDANLWIGAATTNPLLSKTAFALEIDYATSIKADEIVNVSLVEMARLRSLSEAQIKAWTADLKKAFPDVKSGDKLTGVYLPKMGTRFFFNSRLTSEINDPDFGDAFFAIWLDAKAKRLDLRRALLGQTAVS